MQIVSMVRVWCSSRLKMMHTTTRHRHDMLRLVCIIFAVFLFVIISLLITLSVLGVMKTITVWDMLNADIHDEIIENRDHSSANLMKLNESLDKETTYSSICIILTGFSTQLGVACMVLLYGVTFNKAVAIYAWILYSCTNMAYMILLVVFLNTCTKIPFHVGGLKYWFEGFILCLGAYNLLLLFYARTLNKDQAIVVKSYGGYKHTVKQEQLLAEKSENYIV